LDRKGSITAVGDRIGALGVVLAVFKTAALVVCCARCFCALFDAVYD